MPARRPIRLAILLPLFGVGGCWSPATNRSEADEQVYGILEDAAEHVSGEKKRVTVERPIDTLRQRLLASRAPVQLTMLRKFSTPLLSVKSQPSSVKPAAVTV